MITLKQIVDYKVNHDIAKISITRNNYVKLYYNDCTSCYISLDKFIYWVSVDGD